MISISTVYDFLNDENLVKSTIHKLEIPTFYLDDAVKKIQFYLTNIRPEISIVIEDSYIDRVYRNEYYSYFSTKLEPCCRDCIKLSFIDSPIDNNNLLNTDDLTRINERYLGFMVLRPIFPGIVGRTVLSPTAMHSHLSDIKICKVAIKRDRKSVV